MNSKIANLSAGIFTNNGNIDQGLGGAVHIKDSTVMMQNTRFFNNTAVDGGSIYFS